MGVRGFVAAVAGVVMATLIVLVVVLLIDVNHLTDRVTGLEGATASAQNDPRIGELQTSVDAANQGIGAVTLPSSPWRTHSRTTRSPARVLARVISRAARFPPRPETTRRADYEAGGEPHRHVA
jgi:hypothetical protein